MQIQDQVWALLYQISAFNVKQILITVKCLNTEGYYNKENRN